MKSLYVSHSISRDSTLLFLFLFASKSALYRVSEPNSTSVLVSVKEGLFFFQFRKKYKFVFFRITTKSPLAKGNSFTRYRRRYFLLLYIRSGYALRFYGIVFAAWLARQYLPPSLFLFIAITIYALVKRDAAQRCENRVDP